MAEPKHMQHLPGSGLGLVFTDARGRVVFVDSNFLTMSGQSESSRLVGEMFARVVKADSNRVNELIQTVAKAGFVKGFELDLGVPPDSPIRVACSGVANYDEYSAFIGADLTLRDTRTGAPAEDTPPAQEDILARHIQQIEGTVESEAQREHEAEDMLLQSYFTAQAGALQVLLGRMGGARVQEKFEELINQSAAKNSWPLQCKGGLFVIDTSRMPSEALKSILDELVSYAGSVVGNRAIGLEMQKVDSQVSERARNLAQEAGIRLV
jgi:hypothetical protein